MKNFDARASIKSFREDPFLIQSLKNIIWKYVEKIQEREDGPIKIMNFCGTHEWATVHHGIKGLIPPSIELVAGPGCPVCVTPGYYVEVLIKLALEGVRIYTYGDAFKLRTTGEKHPASLQEAKADGADISVVYSFLDAVKDARASGKESIFFGIGFETTAPSYAVALKEEVVPENLKLLSSVRLTPPAMKKTIKIHRERGLLPLKGIIAPGHVSAVIGAKEWAFLPKEYSLPTVVAGFEPADVLMAIALILQMIKNEKPAVKVEYRRLVKWEGNEEALKAVEEIFDKVYAAWRGIGMIPRSGLKLREKFFERSDALKHYGFEDISPSSFVYTQAQDENVRKDLPPGCRCGEVVVGAAKPTDCPLFMKKCTPENPWGPCMVSSEGACAVWGREIGGREDVLGSDGES
ncbi:MAG: hydrogenase formation protein HypD [Candidatus Hadarchaeales archaeon]